MDLAAAKPPPEGAQSAAVVLSTAASLSVAVPRHAQVRLAIGMRPREGAPVPIYYSALGTKLAFEAFPPVGIRAGLDFYPSGFNDWLPHASTGFDGLSGDLDLTLSAARPAGGLLPYLGLGGRAIHLTPREPGQVPHTGLSFSLIAGVRVAGGLALETRYPLLGPPTDPPAHFETTVGLWWSL